MKKTGIAWPKLVAALVLLLAASIVLWILHVLLHESVGAPLLLLSVISMFAFFLTTLLMVFKFCRLISQKV